MSMAKTTNNGKRGGMLKGPSHAKGGIPAIVTDAGNKPVELEGDEAIINKQSMNSDKVITVTGTPCEIASKINSMDGNGVKIPCPQEGDHNDCPGCKFGDGGLVSFNKKMATDDYIGMWRIDYDGDIASINEMVARNYLYELAQKYFGSIGEIEFVNWDKKPQNLFQMRMYVGDKILDTNPFIYVDDNHRAVLKRTKVELLNDKWDTIKKNITLSDKVDKQYACGGAIHPAAPGSRHLRYTTLWMIYG